MILVEFPTQSGQARAVSAIGATQLSQKWKENIFLQFCRNNFNFKLVKPSRSQLELYINLYLNCCWEFIFVSKEKRGMWYRNIRLKSKTGDKTIQRAGGGNTSRYLEHGVCDYKALY